MEAMGRRARKRQSVREALATIAGQLFERDGYESVTLDQIALTADVARGTLYNHFPTKAHLLAAWIHQQLARDLESAPIAGMERQEFPDGAAILLDLSARWCVAHRDLLPPYLQFCFMDMASPEAARGADGLLARYAQMIGNSQASGRIRADLQASHLSMLFHHLYLGALMRWLTLPNLSLGNEFSTALDVFLQGCSSSGDDTAEAS